MGLQQMDEAFLITSPRKSQFVIETALVERLEHGARSSSYFDVLARNHCISIDPKNGLTIFTFPTKEDGLSAKKEITPLLMTFFRASPVLLPGEGTNNFLKRFVSKNTKEKILDQARRDDLEQYIELLVKGDLWACRWWALRLKLMPLYLLGLGFSEKAWDFVMGRKNQKSNVHGDSSSDDYSSGV